MTNKEQFDTKGIQFDAKGNPIVSVTIEEKEKAKQDAYIKRQVKQVSKLVSVKNKSKSELETSVKKRILLKELEVNQLFSDKKEVQLARDLAKKYLTEFTPLTISDKNNLRSVIYLEVLQYRLQAVMNELTAQGSTAIPLNLVDSIHKNLKEIALNKERLGLIGKDKNADEQAGLHMVQNLKEKFKVWRNNNQGSRTMVCPCCGEMVLLKIRMDKWIAQKHPYFKDRFLANKHLMLLYIQEKLSKEDVSLVLECSPDYIDWLLEKLWLTDPEYRKELKKYETKKTQELDKKLLEAEEKMNMSVEDDEYIESGEDTIAENIDNLQENTNE